VGSKAERNLDKTQSKVNPREYIVKHLFVFFREEMHHRIFIQCHRITEAVGETIDKRDPTSEKPKPFERACEALAQADLVTMLLWLAPP
jgi:hypothetical protein